MGCRLIQTPVAVVVQAYASEIHLKHAVYAVGAQLVQLEYAVCSVEQLPWSRHLSLITLKSAIIIELEQAAKMLMTIDFASLVVTLGH